MGSDTLNAKLLQRLTTMREAFLFKILLKIQKEYDALDRDICLEITAVYGVSPRTLQLLRTYWERLFMVARVGRYFGLLFKGYHR